MRFLVSNTSDAKQWKWMETLVWCCIVKQYWNRLIEILISSCVCWNKHDQKSKIKRKTIVHKIWRLKKLFSMFWLAQILAVFPLSAFLKIFLLNCYYQFANLLFGRKKCIMCMNHMSREWIVSLIQGAKCHVVCILKSLLLHFSHPLGCPSCHHVCEH